MRVRILTLLLVFAPLALFAQSASSISGAVTDGTGAILPGVTVSVTNVDTGFTRTLVTGADGRYRAANVPLGNYEVRGELSGFRTVVRRGMTLNVGVELSVDLRLEVGEVTEEVLVTGQAPVVETSRSIMSGLVEARQIENLPLSGRSYIDLALLQPGVVLSTTAGGSVGRGRGLKVTIGGSRQSMVNYTMDGSDITDTFGQVGGVSGRVLGLDAVREFRVVTSPFSAEYAKAAGGEVQIVTRSGTNEFHGTVFEFHRNDALNTKGFFDRIDTPPFRLNQFGGSLGGPIVSQRMHFFGAYEGLRERLTTSRFSRVPDPLLHQGYAPNPAGEIQYYGVDRRIAPYLALYPLPNGTLHGDGTGDFLWTGKDVTDENYVMGRADHQITDSHKAYGRYVRSIGTKTVPDNRGMSATEEANRTHYLSVGLDSVLSSRAVNALQVSYNKSFTGQVDYAVDKRLGDLLYFSRDLSNAPVVGATFINPGAGLDPLGSPTLSPHAYGQNLFQLKNDVTLERTSHSLKIGANISHVNEDYDSAFHRQPGNYAFTQLRDFLRASANTYTATFPGSDTARDLTKWMLGFYVQDDWRVKPRLTLNLGLRYEPGTVPKEAKGRTSQLRNPEDPNATIDDIVVGDPYILNNMKKAFSPRAGFAWDVTGSGRTAVRAGVGLFNDPVPWLVYRMPWNRTPPYHMWGVARTRDVGPIDFPNSYTTQTDLLRGSIAIDYVQFDIELPRVLRYAASVQHELRPGLGLEVQYARTRGYNMIAVADINQRVPEILPDGRLFFGRNAPIYNSRMERIRGRQSDSSLFYDAIILGLRQRYRDRFQFQVSYTLAKAKDDGSNIAGTNDFSNDGLPVREVPPGFLTREDNRGLAAFDVRQNLVISGSYELPGPETGIARAVLGGWAVNGAARLMGGTPFTPVGSRSSSYRNTRTWGEVGEGPPNLVPGREANSIRPGNHTQYFDPSVFALPEPGFFGDLTRNSVISPGVATVDFSVIKDNHLGVLGSESRIQLRAEFFNIFNRVNFGTPNTTLFTPTGQPSPTAGRITTTTIRPREIQIGIRLLF